MEFLLKFFGNISDGFFFGGNVWRNLLREIFWKDFLGECFWVDFFGRIFGRIVFGGILWEELFVLF